MTAMAMLWVLASLLHTWWQVPNPLHNMVGAKIWDGICLQKKPNEVSRNSTSTNLTDIICLNLVPVLFGHGPRDQRKLPFCSDDSGGQFALVQAWVNQPKTSRSGKLFLQLVKQATFLVNQAKTSQSGKPFFVNYLLTANIRTTTDSFDLQKN